MTHEVAAAARQHFAVKHPTLALDEIAWVAGFRSGNLQLADACPFGVGSVEALSWVSGWIEGAAIAPFLPRPRLPER
jgi:hypothetical protein